MFEGMYLLFLLTIGAGLFGIISAADDEDPDLQEAVHVITRRSVHKAASIGSSEVLECEINTPVGTWTEHIITWKKQGIEVPIFIQFNGYPPYLDSSYEGRVRLVDQASIELKDIRIEDEGWFECTIAFMDGNDDTNTNGTWTYLSVNSPPILDEVSPSFLIQKEGDSVDLFCGATATPEPTLAWLKDDKEITPSDRVVISGNRVHVKELVRSDGGAYVCQFKNVVGQVSHLIKLVIEGNAYIMVPPKNVTAKEGEEVTLKCEAEAYPNNITYRWFKNDTDVQTMSDLMSRANIYAEGSFVITSLMKEDFGWYKCRPSNGLGEPPEAKAYLNVTYMAKVTGMSTQVYLPQGMMGRIDCPVIANPPVNMIIWTKNDRTIDFSRNPRLKMNKQGTLVFDTVMGNDEGSYSCTPQSTLGTGEPSTPVQVLVRDPPHFATRPKPIYQRQVTQQVTLPCRAEGDPKPSITWRKADGGFPPSSKTMLDDGNLTIVNLGKEDHGSYECVASNVVTSVVTTTLLIIELTSPHAPFNVSVDTSQHAAKVSWLPAYDGGYDQHYVLWFRRDRFKHKSDISQDGESEWKTLRVIPDQATSITVYNLYADTNYEFMVLSRNRLGDGLFSKNVAVRTKGVSPSDGTKTNMNTTISPSPPQPRGPIPPTPWNITIVQQMKGLLIRWYQPPSKSPVKSFLIEFRTVGPWVPLVTVESDKTHYEWETVSRGARYYFRVTAQTEMEVSNASHPVSFYTTDPRKQGYITDGMIGGIVGGLLFLFVAIILAVLAVKIFNKRKQREKAMRYGNVKYFGPKHMDTNKKSGVCHSRGRCYSYHRKPLLHVITSDTCQASERDSYLKRSHGQLRHGRSSAVRAVADPRSELSEGSDHQLMVPCSSHFHRPDYSQYSTYPDGEATWTRSHRGASLLTNFSHCFSKYLNLLKQMMLHHPCSKSGSYTLGAETSRPLEEITRGSDGRFVIDNQPPPRERACPKHSVFHDDHSDKVVRHRSDSMLVTYRKTGNQVQHSHTSYGESTQHNSLDSGDSVNALVYPGRGSIYDGCGDHGNHDQPENVSVAQSVYPSITSHRDRLAKSQINPSEDLTTAKSYYILHPFKNTKTHHYSRDTQTNLWCSSLPQSDACQTRSVYEGETNKGFCGDRPDPHLKRMLRDPEQESSPGCYIPQVKDQRRVSLQHTQRGVMDTSHVRNKSATYHRDASPTKKKDISQLGCGMSYVSRSDAQVCPSDKDITSVRGQDGYQGNLENVSQIRGPCRSGSHHVLLPSSQCEWQSTTRHVAKPQVQKCRSKIKIKEAKLAANLNVLVRKTCCGNSQNMARSSSGKCNVFTQHAQHSFHLPRDWFSNRGINHRLMTSKMVDTMHTRERCPPSRLLLNSVMENDGFESRDALRRSLKMLQEHTAADTQDLLTKLEAELLSELQNANVLTPSVSTIHGRSPTVWTYSKGNCCPSQNTITHNTLEFEQAPSADFISSCVTPIKEYGPVIKAGQGGNSSLTFPTRHAGIRCYVQESDML